MNVKTGVVERVKATIAGSRWAGLVGKAAGYGAALALLALIGSGRLSTWISPPAKLSMGIAVAEAATATATASAAPVVAPQAADAGAPEDAGTVAETADAGAGSGSPGVSADGKVILNLATEQDLRRLPHVGATRAKAILALRARMKKFNRVEDLLKVKGFGRRSLARLRPLVRVD